MNTQVLAGSHTYDKPFCNLNGKSLFITGGTGSFGHALVQAVIERFTPERLIIFSRDELKQFEMAQRFSDRQYPFIRYFIGDVRDVERLEIAMRGVDYVIHAAALKQVPIAEYNPFECIQTNVHGAENVVRAAIRANVRRVVALSTDKAANPINLYGASKLASDKIFIAANALGGSGGTRFAVVRYGNVVGSRGSIVPIFEKLVASGAKSLPITDKRMTRFIITLRQGVNLVLSSLEMMEGGELYIPKIPSVRVTDIAEAMLPGADFEEIGIRPGEKLHEIMISSDDARKTLDLQDRYVIEPLFDFWTRTAYKKRGAVPVEEEFCYASNTNSEWLNVEQIKAMLRRPA